MIEPANAIVAPIPPKATPLILTTDEERDIRMRAGWRARLAFRNISICEMVSVLLLVQGSLTKKRRARRGMKWDA